MTTQNGRLLFYTRCMWRFYALTAFWKGFLSDWWSRHTRLCACAERLHWDLSAHYLWLLLWGGLSYRWGLFSSLRLGIYFGLFVVNLVNLESVYVVWLIIHHIIQTILYIWKKYRQNAGNVDLLGCSNYYFNKIFGCF